MHDKKLFSLLRALDDQELAAYRKSLHRRFHDDHHMVLVFAVLAKQHPLYPNEKKLAPEYLHQKLFPDKKFSRVRILNLFYDLHVDIQRFLMEEALAGNSFERRMLWLSILEKKGLKDRFNESAEDLLDFAMSTANIGLNELQHQLIGWKIQNYEVESGKPSDNTSVITQYLAVLNRYYLVSRLSAACDMLTLNQLKKTGFDPGNLEQLLAEYDPVDRESHPLVKLYVQVYRLVAEPSDSNFEKAVDVFKSSIQEVSPKEMHRILSHLHNYCISQLRQKREMFQPISHDLTKFCFEHGIFGRLGAMSTTQFNNIVVVACQVKDFKWAENFILEQKPFLLHELREDAVLLAIATLRFEQKKYEEVLELLNKQKTFKEFHHTLRLKSLRLMCHYVLNRDSVDFLDEIDNFRQFLRRRKGIPEVTLQPFRNFLHILDRLYKMQTSRENIRAELKSLGPVVSVYWLESMISEYKPLFSGRNDK